MFHFQYLWPVMLTFQYHFVAIVYGLIHDQSNIHILMQILLEISNVVLICCNSFFGMLEILLSNL